MLRSQEDRCGIAGDALQPGTPQFFCSETEFSPASCCCLYHCRCRHPDKKAALINPSLRFKGAQRGPKEIVRASCPVTGNTGLGVERRSLGDQGEERADLCLFCVGGRGGREQARAVRKQGRELRGHGG